MKETKQKIEVSYEEWLENESNVDWPGWKKLKEIESCIGKMKMMNDCDWLTHCYFFLNNYIQEMEIKDFLGVEFFGDDHLALRNYVGTNLPDFVDENDETYEYKSTTSRNKDILDTFNWHRADHRYVYFRDEGILYCYDKGKLEAVAEMKFNRHYPKLKVKLAYI